MPSPSSGGLSVIHMLELLEQFPLGDAGAGYGFGSTRTLHVMVEAMRLAFADRGVYMGDSDPGFPQVPEVGLLSPGYIAERAPLISPTARRPSVTFGNPFAFQATAPRTTLLAVSQPTPGEAESTTHVSVMDRWGNAVTYTNTIESNFGAGMIVQGCGFLLNNELTDFNLSPTTHPFYGGVGQNDVQAEKRPRSSMAPTMLFKDGKPIVAFGAAGGATIINQVLQVVLNMVDHGMSIQEAIDAPRISSTGGVLSWETGISQEARDGLRALGHSVGASPSDLGATQGAVMDLRTGKLYGGADGRRNGTVIGLPR